MRNLKIKKKTKESSKIKKTKKKLINSFSLQPLANAYKKFKEKQKKEIAQKIKRDKIEQENQLLQEKKQKIREEQQKTKDEQHKTNRQTQKNTKVKPAKS